MQITKGEVGQIAGEDVKGGAAAAQRHRLAVVSEFVCEHVKIVLKLIVSVFAVKKRGYQHIDQFRIAFILQIDDQRLLRIMRQNLLKISLNCLRFGL